MSQAFYLMNKFKFGCSNKNRFKRIQIVFNEKNRKFIEQYLKINKREIYGLETFNDGRQMTALCLTEKVDKNNK